MAPNKSRSDDPFLIEVANLVLWIKRKDVRAVEQPWERTNLLKRWPTSNYQRSPKYLSKITIEPPHSKIAKVKSQVGLGPYL